MIGVRRRCREHDALALPAQETITRGNVAGREGHIAIFDHLRRVPHIEAGSNGRNGLQGQGVLRHRRRRRSDDRRIGIGRTGGVVHIVSHHLHIRQRHVESIVALLRHDGVVEGPMLEDEAGIGRGLHRHSRVLLINTAGRIERTGTDGLHRYVQQEVNRIVDEDGFQRSVRRAHRVGRCLKGVVNRSVEFPMQEAIVAISRCRQALTLLFFQHHGRRGVDGSAR